MRKLDEATQRRVFKAVDGLATEPRPYGCRKLEGGEGAFRIRIGDYRIIYTIDDTILIVAIERVRHRREVYR